MLTTKDRDSAIHILNRAIKDLEQDNEAYDEPAIEGIGAAHTILKLYKSTRR